MAISNSMTMVNALIKPVATDIRVSSIVSSGVGGTDHPIAQSMPVFQNTIAIDFG
jgi:hypothetical protein